MFSWELQLLKVYTNHRHIITYYYMPMERTLPGPTVGEIYCVVKPPKKNLTESIILQTNVESIFCIINSIGLVNQN